MLKKYLTLITIPALFVLNGCDLASTTSNQEGNAPAPQSTSKEAPQNTNSKTQENRPTTTQNNTPLKQIDVLVVVDTNDAGTKNGTTNTKIDHYMSVANQVFRNSTVPVKLNVVKTQPYTFSNQTSKAALSEIYHNKNIAAVRDSVHADLVVIYRNHVNDGMCGIAYINKALEKSAAYAHVSLECPSTTTAHEVGHTMGLAHSSKKTAKHGRFAYGHGYGVEGEFSTIMSYKSTYHTSVRVFNYSSPNLSCQGYECGVANVADSVSALKNSVNRVAHFN